MHADHSRCISRRCASGGVCQTNRIIDFFFFWPTGVYFSSLLVDISVQGPVYRFLSLEKKRHKKAAVGAHESDLSNEVEGFLF